MEWFQEMKLHYYHVYEGISSRSEITLLSRLEWFLKKKKKKKMKSCNYYQVWSNFFKKQNHMAIKYAVISARNESALLSSMK